jgi:poly-gamma-glutamate synthesis protein (capsule biosynthesis protein)
MKNIILLIVGVMQVFAADYTFSISEINPNIKQRMIRGNSWRKNCPVQLQDLRYLNIGYIDFEGKSKVGELIVHKDVAEDVTQIFEMLYFHKYPINKMQLVSNYGGNDYQSIESDNTSAFNCRPVTGDKNKWSNHAYGKAIDINPIENPYVSRKGTSSHSKSTPYLPAKRVHKNNSSAVDRAMFLKTDIVVRIFKDFGWRWGGDWKGIKDFQHFDKNKQAGKIYNNTVPKKVTKPKNVGEMF